MAVVLGREVLKGLIDAGTAIDLLEKALLDEAAGQTAVSPKYVTDLGFGSVRTLVAANHRSGYFATKSYNVIDGVGVRFVISLYDLKSGALLALLDGADITSLRTGGASGVAARHAGLGGSPLSLGIVGSGHQARGQLESLAAVLNVKSVAVFSPTPANREAFAREMGDRLGIAVEPVATAEAAVGGSDVVVTASSARTPEPVVRGEWLASCRLLCAIGNTRQQFAEVDEQCFRIAGAIVVDSLHAIREAGELIRAEKAGALPPGKVSTLAELVKRGRLETGGMVLFKSVGTALQDLALAEYCYEKLATRSDLPIAPDLASLA